MPGSPTSPLRHLTFAALADDGTRLERLFGRSDLLPLWIAEPYVDLSPEIRSAIQDRARAGWYGYETRPREVIGAFWEWMLARHGWAGDDVSTSVSPSVGSSIGVLIDILSEPGDGVILQPPVFTDFKPLVVSSARKVVRNPLALEDGRYHMDLVDLAAKASDPATRLMILCNPHNPVGRMWTSDELSAVARVCAENDVFVISDEIHADLGLPPNRFVPFATIAPAEGVRWAATHGPIKTFGLAGVCDTLLISDDEHVNSEFRTTSSRLHLTRNNVFATAAFETAYRSGGPWLDEFLDLVAANAAVVATGLPGNISLVTPEATFLAWIDFRSLGLDVPELAAWLVDAGLALSPGHWFGREGAGFARMTIAAPPDTIERAVELLAAAV